MARNSKRKNDDLSKLVTLIAVIIAILVGLHEAGYITIPFLSTDSQMVEFEADGNAYVHFIDVGQGDCQLIISDDGSTMLIDGGEVEYGAVVVSYLNSIGIDHLDYIIGSHPHSDHIGGLIDVIASDITVDAVIMPQVADEYTPTTRTYEDLLLAIVDEGCSLYIAKTDEIPLGSGTVYNYMTDYSDDNMNNYSVATKFVFGNRSFLFTGDAETEIERELIRLGYDVDADVYKVAHHGSSTSSNREFLNAISPDYCVIEVGADNSYGHPHKEIVQRLKSYTDTILRTDLNGNIVFTTDGNTMTYYCDK